MNDQKGISPVFKKKVEVSMSFSEALVKLLEGKKIKRVDWTDKDYGYFGPDGILMINRNDKPYQWIVHKLDIIATDWMVVAEAN